MGGQITEVVAALVTRGNRFLAARRPANKTRALLWEFAGGKVEANETKQEALVRECREELGVSVSVGNVYAETTYVYPDITVHLTLFRAAFRGEPQALEHSELRWIAVSEIDGFEFCPADAPILNQMKAEEAALKETRVKGKRIFSGHVLTLLHDTVRLPDGTLGSREAVRHPGGVCVAPLDENGELIFVRQWRYPYDEVTLELPAGKLNRGEDELCAAARELAEETGAQGSLKKLGEMYPSPGYTDEVIRLYLAENLVCGESHPDDDEFLFTEHIPLPVAVDMVLSGGIKDAKTCQLVLMLDKMKHEEG